MVGAVCGLGALERSGRRLLARAQGTHLRPDRWDGRRPDNFAPRTDGGSSNWDYRFCWLRDATLTLYALMLAGYTGEAEAWREWLLRAVAGAPSALQTIYGVAGERRLPEHEATVARGLCRLAAGSNRQRCAPSAAARRLRRGTRCALQRPPPWHRAGPLGRSLEQNLLDTLEGRWREPDEGIWEIRGPRQQLTHSKVMAWVAFDRAIKSVEGFGLEGPVDRWRRIQATIHAEVCARGYDGARNTFTQVYGRPEVDASLLMIPRVGFLPPTDGRVRGTVEAIERDLVTEGLVLRYRTDTESSMDGLPPGEGVFLPCSFWLADAYAQMGRHDDARRLFERLLALRNDVGLLPEEYDPHGGRFLGNFPQAFSHVALVNTAYNLSAGRNAGTVDKHGREAFRLIPRLLGLSLARWVAG